ncbi:MAG: hypothetical protein RR365_01175 [Bacteroides sp.]
MKDKILWCEGLSRNQYVGDVNSPGIRVAFRDRTNNVVCLYACSEQFVRHMKLDGSGILARPVKVTDSALRVYKYGNYNTKFVAFTTDGREYCKKNILDYICEAYRIRFTDIRVADRWYGYHVMKNSEVVPFEDFTFDSDKAAIRREIFDAIDHEYRRIFNTSYSCVTVENVLDDSIVFSLNVSDRSLYDAKLQLNQRVFSVSTNPIKDDEYADIMSFSHGEATNKQFV